MSVETDISDALTQATETVAASLGLTVSYPNRDFTPPDNNGRYLEVMHFRNTNQNPTWGIEKTLLGIWQIAVVDPLKEGEIPSTVHAAAIIDAFGKNTKIFSGVVRLQITQAPTLLTMVQDGARALFPVSIPYRVFKV